MLHSQEFKSLISKFLLVLLGLTIFSVLCSKVIISSYQTYAKNQNAKIITSLIEVHPELEEEIIHALQEEKNTEKGKELLEKYAITNENILLVTESNATIKIFTSVFFVFITILITITVVYFFHLAKIFKKFDHINQYMCRIHI